VLEPFGARRDGKTGRALNCLIQQGAVVTFAGINYLAVVVAAVAAWLGSAVWYMSLSRLYS
jgi:hypothetical protein